MLDPQDSKVARDTVENLSGSIMSFNNSMSELLRLIKDSITIIFISKSFNQEATSIDLDQLHTIIAELISYLESELTSYTMMSLEKTQLRIMALSLLESLAIYRTSSTDSFGFSTRTKQ